MSCSEDNAKSMQFVVTATRVVASMTFCQLPMPAIRLQTGGGGRRGAQGDRFGGGQVRRGHVGVSRRLDNGRVYRGKADEHRLSYHVRSFNHSFKDTQHRRLCLCTVVLTSVVAFRLLPYRSTPCAQVPHALL